ncbi:MAG: T9SS type A sorting domain-containing protein, partial [Bacteroidales bacterium]
FKPYNSADFGYGSSYTYFWMDNCNVTANKLTVIVPDDNLIQNGDFSLPDDSVEHKNLNNIPAWKTDTESEDFNGRSNVNTGSRTGEAVAWLWDETPGIYQVIGTVPSVSTKFDVNFELSCFYSWWSDYKSDFYVIFSSFTGDDATTRIPLDTIKFVYNCVNSDWFNFHTLEGSDTIVAGNPHAGEKLVVEFKPYNSADFGYGSSYTYFWMDNCSVKASPVTVIIPEDNLVLNGHFSLPEDSVEHKNLNNIPAWKTDTESEDFNGRSNVNTGPRKGEAVAWLWDETPGIYQVIGTVPSVSTKFDVSFELSCSYSWWSDYNSDFYVIFSSFTGDDATTRVPLDTIKFTYNCGSSDWYNFHTLEGSDTIRSGHPHAGEKLVIEFKPYNSADFGYGSSYTYFWMDNVVVKSSEVIINGVEKHEVDHIKVWASDHQITVDGAREINNISVYNLMGQKVYSARPTGNVVRVPELSGFYIVVVDADHLQKSQKVIF